MVLARPRSESTALVKELNTTICRLIGIMVASPSWRGFTSLTTDTLTVRSFPFAAQAFLSHQPMVAGAWMGLAVKTDGAALASGGITEALILSNAAAEGINYQKGWILGTTATVKIFIDIFIDDVPVRCGDMIGEFLDEIRALLVIQIAPEPPHAQSHQRLKIDVDIGDLPHLLLLLLALLPNVQRLKSFYIPSGSMEPTLIVNDRLIAALETGTLPARNALVIFRAPDDPNCGPTQSCHRASGRHCRGA